MTTTRVPRTAERGRAIPAAQSALLARAALWQWAARAYWYPEAHVAAALRDPETRRTLDSAAAVPVPAAGDAVPQALAAVWAAVDALATTDISLAEEHTALFARNVVVPPHGTVYGAGLDSMRTHDLAQISGFYEAFGLQVSASRAELADHISMELEFVAALLAKEAYALECGWTGRAKRAAVARRRFVDDHVRPWLPKFAERLAKHHRLDFYPAVTNLVLALLVEPL
jgi:TorA maturation chaperone TorD